MPEPNYNDGDPPGLFILLVAAAVVFFALILFQACR